MTDVGGAKPDVSVQDGFQKDGTGDLVAAGRPDAYGNGPELRQQRMRLRSLRQAPLWCIRGSSYCCPMVLCGRFKRPWQYMFYHK